MEEACIDARAVPGLPQRGPLGEPLRLCLWHPPSRAQSASGAEGASGGGGGDEEKGGRWTGLAAFREIARQKCLQRQVASEVQWEYLERLFAHCLGGSGGEASVFSVAGDAVSSTTSLEDERCSAKQMEALGVNASKVLACSRASLARLLLEEAATPQPGVGNADTVAVRIAGWRYGGPLEPDLIVESICASLDPGPPACGGPWRWREPRWFVQPVPLWPTGVVAMLVSAVAPVLLPWACRLGADRLRRCRCSSRAQRHAGGGAAADGEGAEKDAEDRAAVVKPRVAARLRKGSGR